MLRYIYGINTAGNCSLALTNMGFPIKALRYEQSKTLCGFYLLKFIIVDEEKTLIRLEGLADI